MKLYSFDGQTFKSLPDPFLNRSPMTDELFEQLGGTITEDGNPTPEEEFEVACAQFRTICAAIGQFIGAENFHGGFGEMASFASSEAYQANPVMGTASPFSGRPPTNRASISDPKSGTVSLSGGTAAGSWPELKSIDRRNNIDFHRNHH